MSLYVLSTGWYDNFVALFPEGKLFSWRSVFDAIPSILEKLPTTLLLTLGGSVFGLILAMLFAIVKINRVKVLYPIQAAFVSFLRGTPILVQLMLTYYGIPLALKALNQKTGLELNINAIPASVFAITAFAFNEAAYTSETIRARSKACSSPCRRLWAPACAVCLALYHRPGTALASIPPTAPPHSRP